MGFVFFIYGLAFFSLGLSVAVYPRKESSYTLSREIRWIAAFGFIHGANEWVDMIRFIGTGEMIALEVLRPWLLVVSFACLVQFGVNMLFPNAQQRPFIRLVMPGLALAVCVVSLGSSQPLHVSDVAGRYLLAVPGTILSGMALRGLTRSVGREIAIRIKNFLGISVVAMFAYGAFSGLVVPDSSFFPASIVNYSAFQGMFGFPVQIARTVCALALSFSLINVLRVFDLEFKEKLRESRDSLEDAVQARTQDLTRLNVELKREIAERGKAEEFVANILETVDEGFIVVDRNYRIVSANRAYCEQVGREASEVVGRGCYEVSHVTDKPCWKAGEDCSVKRTFETGLASEAVHEHRDADGNIHIVRLKSYPVRSPEGEITGAIETAIDVTSTMELEAQLQHSQKMEAVGQLAGGIAHDFNNVLTAIAGYTDLLQQEMKADDPLLNYVEIVNKAVDKAADLTQGLLAYGRRQVFNVKAEDINEMVKETEKLLRRMIGEDIDLSLDFSPERLIVMADRNQISQVLMNLATNARDAMPQGGSLTIQTAARELTDHEARRGGLDPGRRYACIRVSDTGTGIGADIREKIFEPFFTTKEAGRGTGLGLSMVFGIVKQHEGFVDLVIGDGPGTTFLIYLPLAGQEPAVRLPEAVCSAQGGNETILLAEDDPVVRNLFKVVLEGKGYTVIQAADGEEALARFRQHAESIRLLLFDVTMPNKGGKEAFREIRSAAPHMKCLFVTGYDAEAGGRSAYSEPGMFVLFKPVKPHVLLRRIRELLDDGCPAED